MFKEYVAVADIKQETTYNMPFRQCEDRSIFSIIKSQTWANLVTQTEFTFMEKLSINLFFFLVSST